jgi:hypothetical protein
MSLNLELDTNLRFVLQPDYRHHWSAGVLAQQSLASDPLDNQQFYVPPTQDCVMLKPLQMHPDFINQQPQLDLNCVLRIPPLPPAPPQPFGTPLWHVNPTDQTQKALFELAIGNPGNPWVSHTACSSILPAGFFGSHPIGIKPWHSINSAFDQSESGGGTNWNAQPPIPVPALSVPIMESYESFPNNQGWVFRWWQPPPLVAAFQTIYTFVFAQYLVICRNAQVEVFEDVSPAGDRSLWQLQYKRPILLAGRAPFDSSLNPTIPFGETRGVEGLGPDGHWAQLWVIPFRRQKVLFMSQTGDFFVANVRAHPRRTMDGSEWDILRPGTVSVWALAATQGVVQVQTLKYSSGVANLRIPQITVEYTPLGEALTSYSFDADAGSQLLTTPVTTPPLYSFPLTPTADDCPPPTNLASHINRTYGDIIRFAASPDLRVSPLLYSIDLVFDPIFIDNPATPTVVGDKAMAPMPPQPTPDPPPASINPPASSPPVLVTMPVLMNAEISLGSQPGEGRATFHVRDVPPYPLSKYRFRSEMPVQLQENGLPIFSGYTDRLEVQPLRGDAGAPIDMRLRCNDRWLLLETTLLREQRDWSHVGHITVVDTIARQCGIDTGDLHPDGTLLADGAQSMAGGSKAEYPAGWDGALSSTLNVPLGTPFLTPDMLEGNQLLGWKPQPHDTGAQFIKRIADIFSLWLVGFRADGTFYYLPYAYFTTPSLTFFAHAGRRVVTGLMGDPTASIGTGLFISAGVALIDGRSVTVPAQTVGLSDNSTSTLFVDGMGLIHSSPPLTPPAASVTIGQATTKGGNVQSFDASAGSGRQIAGSPTFRHPVEYRTIEPSGNVVQVTTRFQLDLTANRSGLYVDQASISNPQVVNYLGRPKWFTLEIGGAFSCSQLNWMAYQAFKKARIRRVRISFDATFVPAMKIGQVFTLEGIGPFRLLEMRATHTREGWEVANYVGEKIEDGFGLPS